MAIPYEQQQANINKALTLLREVAYNLRMPEDLNQIIGELRKFSDAENSIECGYCHETYVRDGGWHCPHCGGC